VRFSDGDALARLPVTAGVVLQPVLPVLYGLGLALLIVALARPQKGLSESRVKTQGVDIVLLVDVSTSMRAIDFSTSTREINRLDAAKEVIDRFVKRRENDRIGIVAFSAMPYSVAPLTLDHGWLILRMQQVETGMLEDGTAIGTAIASAVNRLRTSEAKTKLVILLTDGINNAGDLTPDNAAQAAKALGIKIYAVGAGASGIVTMPVQDPFGQTRYIRQRSDIDEAALKRIADATGGQYFRATDLDSLKRVYDEIDRMEKTEIDVEQFTRFEEKFSPFLIAGLVCLTLERLISLSRFGRLP
jgi:Ca-activated chloride channel family protein